jgi:hypothetical protein
MIMLKLIYQNPLNAPRGIVGRETEESLAEWKRAMEEKKAAMAKASVKRRPVQNRITRNRRLRISEPEAEK